MGVELTEVGSEAACCCVVRESRLEGDGNGRVKLASSDGTAVE